jgi:hypothetical protein
VSELADDKTVENSQIDPDVVSLLKEEYFHLQKTVEDFDQRALNQGMERHNKHGWHRGFIPSQ